MIELKNGVQIPESSIVQQITAALDGFYAPDTLGLVQYDDTMPVVAVQLTTNQQPYTPGESAQLNYRMGKPCPDTHTVYNPCLGVDEEGVIYFSITVQGTTTYGETTLTVEVTDGGVKNSAPIRVIIARNPVQKDSVESTDEFLTLQEILAEAEKWGQIVQTNASNIQQVVDNLTDIQNAAENAQAAAASAEAAQQAAQEALGFRTFFSAVRPDKNGNLDPSRPMTVGPAASVEIESAGDRIQSVTAHGFTQQAGTGDPSPTNVRAITNGGLKLVAVTFDGSSDESWKLETLSGGTNRYYIVISNAAQADTATGFALANWLKLAASGQTGNPSYYNVFTITADNRLYVRANNESLDDFKSRLAADPLTVWYTSTDGTGSLYAPIILNSGEYRATCLPLTAPLCEGDRVVSYIESGCDVELVLTGAENWMVHSTGAFYAATSKQQAALIPFSNFYTGVETATEMKNYAKSVQIGSAGIYIWDTDYNGDVEAFKAHLQEKYASGDPVKVWIKSSADVPLEGSIPVSLETHQQAVLVLDGTEGWIWNKSGNENGIYRGVLRNVSPQGKNGFPVCSHAKPQTTFTNTNGVTAEGGTFTLAFPDIQTESGLTDFKAYLAAQYAAGTPVTIVYQLATPITYAHEAVVLEAATGDQLTYTVTGQSGGTVSVALKPFQDGGHAKTAENATNAVTAQTAANSQQLDGLTLSALQDLLVPVGYIFSWAPVDDGPDLSTAQKVAEYFGFGTWKEYGAGQVLVGVDSGQTEFATVGKTGGEKTHMLTVSELASHRHAYAVDTSVTYTGTPGFDMFKVADSGSSNTGETGGNQPHNNLQPYITVYRWQRIA